MNGSIYVNRESGILVQIGPVDDSYAQQVILTGPSRGGNYKIPIAEYDTTFVRDWRPATHEDLGQINPDARPPANADAEWFALSGGIEQAKGAIRAELEADPDARTAPGLERALEILG